MSHVPQPGDIYIVTKEFGTLAGKLYAPGDRFELVEMTDESPFGFESHLGNWWVKCRHFEPPNEAACWSSIWTLIQQGILVWENEKERDIAGAFRPAKEIFASDSTALIPQKIPDYGDKMTTEEWLSCINEGGFIDYDGHGYFSDGEAMFRNMLATPSVYKGKPEKIPPKFTHVIWFNR